MLNVIELENRWRKYKIKSYLPYVSVFFILVLISVLGVFFIQPKKTKVEQKSHIVKKETSPVVSKLNTEVIQIKKSKPVEKEQIKQTVKEAKQQKTKKIVLSPSLNFISSMKYDFDTDIVYKKTQVKKQKIKQKTKEEEKIKEKVVLKKEKKSVQQEPIQNKKSRINIEINRQDAQKDINDVMKRFQKNNNPALSLFIAKKYYEIGNYRQSYNYALITNGINDEIEISWIIFAKSLVKLNKRDEAINTLKKYINHTHSNQAKILLEDIISGKFR